MATYTTIRDLVRSIADADPALGNELGLEWIAEVVRANRDMFARYEDIDETVFAALIAAAYETAMLPVMDARRSATQPAPHQAG